MTALETPALTTLESVRDAALRLSDAERVNLGNQLLDSVPEYDRAMDDADEDPELFAELNRRLENYRNGTSPGIPGDEFIRRLRGDSN